MGDISSLVEPSLTFSLCTLTKSTPLSFSMTDSVYPVYPLIKTFHPRRFYFVELFYAQTKVILKYYYSKKYKANI